MKLVKTERELLERADNLAGLTLKQVASQLMQTVPDNLMSNKGWVGQVVESYLGASAASKAEPDFPHLGIELKTLPVDNSGKPLESTYVSTVPLNTVGLRWEISPVYAKLSHVLWVPIEGDKQKPLADRQIGTAFLWRPTAGQVSQLRQDWEELMDIIALGQLDRLSASLGKILHIRPKGANAKALCMGIGEEGSPIYTLPRGFYLRPAFTHEILLGWLRC